MQVLMKRIGQCSNAFMANDIVTQMQRCDGSVEGDHSRQLGQLLALWHHRPSTRFPSSLTFSKFSSSAATRSMILRSKRLKTIDIAAVAPEVLFCWRQFQLAKSMVSLPRMFVLSEYWCCDEQVGHRS